MFSKSYLINKKYFPKDPDKFIIFICNSEEEFRKYAKPYYSKLASAVGLGSKGIATRSPDFVEKIGKYKRTDFQNLMNHEVSHIFWYQLCKTWSPQWFIEGLACHIGKNFVLSNNELKKIIKKNNIKGYILDFRYIRRNFKNGHYLRYSIWQAFIGFIIMEYSLEKIKKFTLQFSKDQSKDNYNRLFKDLFGKNDKALFKEFIKNY